MNDNVDNPTLPKSPLHKRPDNDKWLVLRNILNIIFMIGAVIGVAIYIKGDQNTGTIVVLAAMAFKIVECIFRFMK